MQFKPDKAKPMSEGTRELGTKFVQALLVEGHDYESIKPNFLALLAKETMAAASKKLASNPGPVYETSGYVRGSMREASKTLGITRNFLSRMFHGAERIEAQ
jgi:hypothetical protein